MYIFSFIYTHLSLFSKFKKNWNTHTDNLDLGDKLFNVSNERGGEIFDNSLCHLTDNRDRVLLRRR